jgi:cell division protein FtsQ
VRLRAVLVLAPLLLIGAVVAAVYTLRIDQVRVTGLRSLSPRAVIEASGLEPGDRILWIRLSRAARKVEAIPSVADAVAERSLPQTVVINVRERVPLVRLDKAPELFVDVEGRVFSGTNADPVPTLAGWRGRTRSGTSVDRVSRFVLEAFAKFPAPLRSKTQTIVVGPPLVLRLDDGAEIRFGRLEDLEQKAAAAEAVLAAEGGQKLEYVDVRSPTVPVVKNRAPVTASPTSAATPVPASAPRTAAPLPPATPAPTPAAPATAAASP